MAREDETRREDPYRPDATPPGATSEMREADGALHDRDVAASGSPGRALDPAARPGVVPPSHAADSPSSGAHAAVEAPRTARGRTALIWVVVAVIVVALAFLLLGFGAEEVEGAATAVPSSVATI